MLAPRGRPIAPAPTRVEAYFTPEEVARGERFARPQLALGLARGAVDAAALALLAKRPPALLRRPARHPVLAGAGAGAILATALTLPPLPLAALSRKRAKTVGLVTQSWGGWAVDVGKATAIQSAFAAAGSAAAVAATRRYPRAWWLPASVASVLVGAVLTTLAPVLLDPVFNDFTRLPEGETRSDVLELASAAGVRVGEIYSIDASRRTTAANAYVTGLGADEAGRPVRHLAGPLRPRRGQGRRRA